MAKEWNESMSTGVLVIDEEHQEWLRRFNEFDDAIINDHGKDMIAVALRFLGQYAEFHFPNEELLASNLLKYGAEKNRDRLKQAIEKNLEDHDLFRHNLAIFDEKLRSEIISMDEVIELKIKMEQWLVRHICEIDCQVFSKEN